MPPGGHRLMAYRNCHRSASSRGRLISAHLISWFRYGQCRPGAQKCRFARWCPRAQPKSNACAPGPFRRLPMPPKTGRRPNLSSSCTSVAPSSGAWDPVPPIPRPHFDCLDAASSNNIADLPQPAPHQKSRAVHGYQQAYGFLAGHQAPLARVPFSGHALTACMANGESSTWRRLPIRFPVGPGQCRFDIGPARNGERIPPLLTIGRRGGAGASQHDGLGGTRLIWPLSVGAKTPPHGTGW